MTAPASAGLLAGETGWAIPFSPSSWRNEKHASVLSSQYNTALTVWLLRKAQVAADFVVLASA
jgi:hypothetical protein